jgi:hypothetical protein
LTKYVIYEDLDSPLSFIIAGGHLTEEKALQLLKKREMIDNDALLKVGEINHVMGRCVSCDDPDISTDDAEFICGVRGDSSAKNKSDHH